MDMHPQSTSYRVLARKYRPQRFCEVVGQDIFIKLLKNAIVQRRIASGFLLTGIRGIGKTSIARLMAKAFNCKQLSSEAEPCNACESCIAILEDRHLDVVEIDAASHTGVDDIRQLIESSHYKAMMGGIKVYIIDEVHMLSKNAFNALLKTLEEPPSHVKFILATTEIHKVPLTIVSRCLQFRLRPLDVSELSNYLQLICTQEQVDCEESALELLAKYSNGSVRDALSLLEQAILLSYSQNNQVSQKLISNMLGATSSHHLLVLLQKILKKSSQEALELIQEIHRQGVSPLFVLEEIGEILYHLSIKALHSSYRLPFESEIRDNKLEEIYKDISFAHFSRLWQMVQKGRQEILETSFPLIAIEMLVMRMCYMGNLPMPEQLMEAFSSHEVVKVKDKVKDLALKASEFPKKASTSTLFDKALGVFKDNIA